MHVSAKCGGHENVEEQRQRRPEKRRGGRSNESPSLFTDRMNVL